MVDKKGEEIRKKGTGLSRRAAFFAAAVIVVAGAALLATRVLPVKIGDESRSATDQRIQGQVTWQQNTSLPPQAMLVVQLTGRDNTNGSQKIISETWQPVSEKIPVDFILPVTLPELDKNYSYALHAKISVGDVLWFVNETPAPVEPERAAYLIRLSMIEHNSNETGNKEHLKGREWIAEDIFGQGVIDGSSITLHVNDTAKDNATPGETRYSAAGSAGCNRYTTIATLNEGDNALKFEAPVTTFMACTEAISNQEAQFTDMLSKTTTYRINPLGLLYLMDANGNTIARFSPSD